MPQLDHADRALAGRSRAARSPVGDRWFKPPRLTAKVGQRITWSFAGAEPHSVTVANGPRGFSSNYLGQFGGTLLVHAHRARHVPPHVPDPPDDDERRR